MPPFEPDFRVVVGARPEGTVVVPRGELDLATGPDLEAVLVAQTGPVVLDLRELSFVDASGLRVLLEAEARSSQNGKNLSFIAGPAVRRLFDIADVPDPLTYIEPPRASRARQSSHGRAEGDARSTAPARALRQQAPFAPGTQRVANGPAFSRPAAG